MTEPATTITKQTEHGERKDVCVLDDTRSGQCLDCGHFTTGRVVTVYYDDELDDEWVECAECGSMDGSHL